MTHYDLPFSDELIHRLRAGDRAAEAAIFDRYSRRLIAFASKRISSHSRAKLDAEDVVLSAYGSFFRTHRGKPFQFADWEHVLRVLTLITRRKCSKEARSGHAARRPFGRETSLDLDQAVMDSLIDRQPSTQEIATVTDIVEKLMASMEPKDQAVVKLFLEGRTAEETALLAGCSERTVGRVRRRVKFKLAQLT